MSENGIDPNPQLQDNSDQGQKDTDQQVINNDNQNAPESSSQRLEATNTNNFEAREVADNRENNDNREANEDNQEEQKESTSATEPAKETPIVPENKGNSPKKRETEAQEETKGDEVQGEVLRPNDNDDDDDIDRDDEEEEYDEGEYADVNKLDIPKLEKEKGRECFSKGNYEEATKHYAKAILAVNFLFKDQMVPSEEKAVELLKDIQIPCYLNNALCFIKLKSWKMAFDNASTALTLDEDNVKALYRKALAAFNLGELEISNECIKRALELEPNNAEIRTLAQDLRQKKKQLQDKEKKMGQQMLQELSKAREEEQEAKKRPKRTTEVSESKSKISTLKDKVMEPILTKKEEVTKKVKTWRDQLKLLILLPLSLLSEVCCRRRLPAQFYRLDESKKVE